MSIGLKTNFGKNTASVSAHKAQRKEVLNSIEGLNPLADLEIDAKEPPRTVDRNKTKE